ncbi:N-acetylneuraminate synthase family protein [Brachybacterium saurashtrense]|uniref:CBS domain-containing protein n=1 Tax=Brachybacterium saurashtrense TaxID=556288 RepID=A0A345YTR9_9MICO|nr:N-acetylneuraminate synthase family protein [Brachybacterium saurashtrense]AXK47321.1 CBS domain-containing protein [Brachybacterium saurashtrense]RRR22747.1 CBS domain-containing protein [Brachybacterium saurashtrense]
MILDRHTAPYTVDAHATVLQALGRINDNRARMVLVVDEHGTVRGTLSDGDVRRWLVGSTTPDLTQPALDAANTDFVAVTEGTPVAEITVLFGDGIDRIPMVDERGRLLAIATPGTRTLTIGSRTVGAGHPALLIGEIGNNHQGDVELATRLVDECVRAGVDAVKFQLRDMGALYRSGGAGSAGEDLGPQYTMNLLAKYSLSVEDMRRVLDHCAERGVDALCTPWDLPSAEALHRYGLPGYKIASADLTNHDLLAAVAGFGAPMIVSTGMSTEQEITGAVEVLRGRGAPFALLQTQSTYPAPFKDVNLRYMDRLAELGDCPVGYSGHERGWHVPLAAVARGAHIVEKHVTLDRTLEGNDHKVSLLPDELAAMVRQVREVEESLGSDRPRELSTGELMNRVNLAKSLVAARDLRAGDTVTTADVDVKSPGRGLQPDRRDALLGVRLHRDVPAGDFFYPGDLAGRPRARSEYSFRRPWGLPVRFHDFRALLEVSQPDFLEFHQSAQDMDLGIEEFFAPGERLAQFVTVHAPDLYPGDFLIDLASPDQAIWERSIHEVQRVVDLARGLTEHFTCAEDPIVVVTMGGFLPDRHLRPEERYPLYERVQQGLERVDEAGVRLTAQTLPPFPWLMGGQQFHNLFMEPEDTVWFCETYGRRLTLDVSHSKLAATFHHRPFSEYLEQMGPYTEHLHIVDSVGVDGEGVQVGEGEVDFKDLAERMDRLAPDAPFIPEIWMGHVNNGEGFFTALDRLREWF